MALQEKIAVQSVASDYDLTGGDLSLDTERFSEYGTIYLELITTSVAVGTIELRASESVGGTSFVQLSSTAGVSGSVHQFVKPTDDFAGRWLRIEILKSLVGVTGTVSVNVIGK